MRSLKRPLLALLVLVLASAAAFFGAYLLLPTQNTPATHFDAIVVLGTPARPDGMPSPEQRERVLEGIREYRAGVAPRVIFTGGPAHNHFIEAHVMAEFAQAQGVPASAILEEDQAQDTIQNIFYTATILHAHNWSSAEVVSSPYHLGRTALILSALNRRDPALHLDWRTHPSHWPPEYTPLQRLTLEYREASRCLYLRLHGFPSSRFLPA